MIDIKKTIERMKELARLLDLETLKKMVADENLEENLWDVLMKEIENRMTEKDYIAFCDNLF